MKCKIESSLYFATLNQMCSEECKNIMLDINQQLVSQCNIKIKDYNELDDLEQAYFKWSNEDFLKLSCSKKKNYCLKELGQLEIDLENALDPDAEPVNVCNDCSKSFAKSKYSLDFLPTLYHARFLNSTEINDLIKKCWFYDFL